MNPIRWEIGKQLSILGGILFVSWILGLILGHMTLIMVSVLCVYIYWHGLEYINLYQGLQSSHTKTIKEGASAWYPITEAIYKWQIESKKHKKKLLSVIKEFRLSTNALPDAVVLVDKNSSIVWSNKACKKLLGLKKKKDIGTRITHLIRHPKFIAYWENEKFYDPLILASPIASNICLSMQITPYSEGQKLIIARDISRINRLEQIRSDFVSNVSHELRTPLTVINGYLETLESLSEINYQQYQQVVTPMLQQGKRMKHIVDELLYLAKLEQGVQLKSTTAIDMPSFLEQITQEAIALSEDQNHQIELKIQTHLRLFAPESDIHRIFSNIVFNAVRYTAAGNKITLLWQENDGEGLFSVKDEGIGITEEDIPRLTERFYRVDPGRSRDEGGTGLGLAIVKHGLERYMGRLTITSKFGQGSTFTCHFPSSWLG